MTKKGQERVQAKNVCTKRNRVQEENVWVPFEGGVEPQIRGGGKRGLN